jgi:hypothetical protein
MMPRTFPKGSTTESGDEALLAAAGERLVFPCSQGQQLLEGRRHVVDVPVQDGAAPGPGAEEVGA